MKIMCIDDTSFFSESLARGLERHGVEVALMSTIQQAVKSLTSDSEYDLILIDLDKNIEKKFNELSLIEQAIKKHFLEIQIFCLSSNTQDNIRLQGFDFGAFNFIYKEKELEKIVGSIVKVCNPIKSFEGTNILLIDDSQMVLKIVSKTFESKGIDVYNMTSVEEALAFYKENRKMIDLVICDLRFPTMSGLEFTKVLRDEIGDKLVPIIAISVSTDESDRIDLYNSGVNDFIQKPFLKEELVKRVFTQLDMYKIKKELNLSNAKNAKLTQIKEEILGICSHDLLRNISDRNKVNYVRDVLEDLVESYKANKRKLDFSEFEFEDLKVLLKESIKLIKEDLSAKKIELELNLWKESEVLIRAQKIKIIRVFNNIFSNAIKYSPKNKTIKVTGKILKNHAYIEFHDEGIGMKPEQLKHVFDSFYKFSSSGTEGEKGYGQGMTISKKTVDAHHGSIHFESEFGQGTKCIICFPIQSQVC